MNAKSNKKTRTAVALAVALVAVLLPMGCSAPIQSVPLPNNGSITGQ